MPASAQGSNLRMCIGYSPIFLQDFSKNILMVQGIVCALPRIAKVEYKILIKASNRFYTQSTVAVYITHDMCRVFKMYCAAFQDRWDKFREVAPPWGGATASGKSARGQACSGGAAFWSKPAGLISFMGAIRQILAQSHQQ